MSSFYWQIISDIFLGIGIVLLITAVLIALRFRIVSGVISEIRSKNSIPAPVRTTPSMKIDITGGTSRNTAVDDVPEEPDSGEITVVVARRNDAEDDGATVVVGNGRKDDFRITNNIIVINADPDMIDIPKRR